MGERPLRSMGMRLGEHLELVDLSDTPVTDEMLEVPYQPLPSMNCGASVRFTRACHLCHSLRFQIFSARLFALQTIKLAGCPLVGQVCRYLWSPSYFGTLCAADSPCFQIAAPGGHTSPNGQLQQHSDVDRLVPLRSRRCRHGDTPTLVGLSALRIHSWGAPYHRKTIAREGLNFDLGGARWGG